MHPTSQQIVSDVQTGLNVLVRFVFELQAIPDGTNVTETITLHMPILLGRFIMPQVKSVQENRIKVLKQRMENTNQKGG